MKATKPRVEVEHPSCGRHSAIHRPTSQSATPDPDATPRVRSAPLSIVVSTVRRPARPRWRLVIAALALEWS
jgi:hypothetical protein